MKQTERGFLLLTSHLGDPERKCLTIAQFRTLAQRVGSVEKETDLRDMVPEDLKRLGYNQDMAQRIIDLLNEEWRLDAYLKRAKQAGCRIVTRISDGYPQVLRKKLGLDAPGCLWYKGDPDLLRTATVSLVGSRDLLEPGWEFARQAGIQAAKQGYTLVSGNARGADRTAQDACIENGGSVISVVADRLDSHTAADGLLLLSEDGFDLPFSSQRALSRNRVIHCLSPLTLVAQCSLKTGGTWDGTVRNLRLGWSKVCCLDDGSEAMSLLTQMGAEPILTEQLSDLTSLAVPNQSLLE